MALPSAAAVIALRILASSTMVMSFKPIGLTLFLRDFIAVSLWLTVLMHTFAPGPDGDRHERTAR